MRVGYQAADHVDDLLHGGAHGPGGAVAGQPASLLHGADDCGGGDRCALHREAGTEQVGGDDLGDPGAVPDDVVDAGHAGARRLGASRSALPFLSGELRFDIAPHLQALPVPAVMLWGEQENQIPASVRARLEGLNPAIGSVRVTGARTNMELEQPEQVVAVIQRFISATGPGCTADPRIRA